MTAAEIVTVLFTDLVGSTELLDRLGEEAAEELRRSHFAVLRAALAAAGDSLLQRRAGAHAISTSSSELNVLRVRARMRTEATSSADMPALPPHTACHTVLASALRAAAKSAPKANRPATGESAGAVERAIHCCHVS